MKKFLFFFGAIMMMVCTAMSLTSCGGDDSDDDYQDNIWYSQAFSDYNGGSDESKVISNAFETQLKSIGWTDGSQWQVHGSLSNYDAKIVEACKKAEQTLSGKTFAGKFTYQITRLSTTHTSKTVVYSYTAKN